MLPLAGEWTLRLASPSTSAGSTLFPGAAPPDRRSTATTAAGASRARRSTSRCARPARSLADVARPRAAPGHVRRLLAAGRPADARARSRAGSPPTRTCASSSTATPDWDDELIDGLVETGAVDSIDFKGAYKGTPVDVETDPAFYRRDRRGVPGRLARGPRPRDRGRARGAASRTTTASPGTRRSTRSTTSSRMPRAAAARSTSSRRASASLEALFAGYDFCAERGMGAYGGGQYELGVGRGQIQYLAALFHPDAPNDIAPSGLRRARARARPAREPAHARPRAHRLPPAVVDSEEQPCRPKQRQIRIEQKGALAAMQRLESRSRRGARGRDPLPRRRPGAPRRPRRRAHGRQALARALPRRDRRRPPAGAAAAAPHGRGLARARRAPRRAT